MKVTNSRHRIAELMAMLRVNQTDFCKKTGIQKSALSNSNKIEDHLQKFERKNAR